jgi:hypothetical protein
MIAGWSRDIKQTKQNKNMSVHTFYFVKLVFTNKPNKVNTLFVLFYFATIMATDAEVPVKWNNNR